jgi:hypothetical protein
MVARMANDGDQGPSPGESHHERVDRELIELLNEIRVALPGVQVLFAFLLTVPFQQRYAKLNEFHRDLMLFALLSSAVSIVLLVAPTAQHRILFRQHDKENVLLLANYLLLAGTVFLAVSISIAVFVVTDIFISRPWASIATAMLALLFVVFWYGVPLVMRLRR